MVREEHFEHLGSEFGENDKCSNEINKRIATASA